MTELPEKLRPYEFHGLVLRKSTRGNEYVGTCPFCDREDKFYVNSLTGMSKCFVCDVGSSKAGMNVYTFIRELHKFSFESTKLTDFQWMADHVSLLDLQSVVEWQLAKSTTTGDWLVPGYNAQCSMVTLYRYIKQFDGGYRAIPTPGLGHQIHGMNLWDNSKPIAYICEGWKDSIVLWEALTKGKNTKEGIGPTASRESSLYAQENVIAVPGAAIFFESWAQLFENKVVNLMFDSDHPKKHPKTGHISPGAGWQGMERIAKILTGSKHKPQEINCIYWGKDGYNPEVKSGYDVRNYLTLP